MRRTLEVLNDLETEGTIGRYAIGGAMAATFYVEPVVTFDLDIFVALPQTAAGLLTIAPIHAALRARGYKEEGVCVLVEGVPVQFLPAYNPLVEEALAEARDALYESTPTRVLRLEHLLAIALQTGRDKDRERVRMFRALAQIDSAYLGEIIDRHGLRQRWIAWNL